ncbi:coiled-coil domain-containing protein 149-B-like [Teleopsis dalmanni]|uniref:coiled-coil domain-containing protein 149-B-like n=1 Tax=Teleopsis dalmanni TaxID=139649 RepID=UPI000D32C60D|nr:coiled-coil domain-containing protein 149-B-like [Teleopsis dalmanni]
MSDDELPSNRQTLPRTAVSYDMLGQHMENYNVETSALHRKLQSKVEAVRILRRDLEKFRTERDQFKLMAETLQLRYSAIKRYSDLGNCDAVEGGNKNSVANLLRETRERNIKLTTEVEALKQKLVELQGDIDILRAKEAKPQRTIKSEQLNVSKMEKVHNSDELQWKQERANFICHLENLKKKNAQLAFDFKAIIDEKEELITERDAYKCKAHRLNHELLVALKANEVHPKFLDIDSILLENKYLQERLLNFENELDLTKQSMNKYKSMLDAKRKKGIIKLGSNSNEENILSHKQVKNLLASGIDLPTKTETIQDLKSLCLALLDNLNDKNLALSHQKKTNKVLATKIAELEQRIQKLTGIDTELDAAATMCDSNIIGYSPAQLLLHGYCPSLVDSNTTNDTNATTVTTIKTTTGSNITEDSGTMSSEPDDSNKTSRGLSDDGMSSLSTESGRSILSSEYGVDVAACNLSDCGTNLYANLVKSSTVHRSHIHSNFKHYLPNSIAKERLNDLKDLPPELAALVQKALHELDMRDFDEVVGTCEDVGEEVNEEHFNTQIALVADEDEQEDDDTIH